MSSQRLELVRTVVDERLRPKSVIATSSGLLFAQNMMYRHNVMVLDAEGEIVAVIDDAIDRASFGIGTGMLRGAPVEAVESVDGRYVFVSNYKMYGPGYVSDADDDCDRGSWDDSLVYRVDVESLTIDAVATVGAVPKFMAVTPDGSRLLVSNWCGFDVSVIDLAGFEEVGRIDVGRHPRGIAVTGDSTRAFVAVMGAGLIREIDLVEHRVVGDVADGGITPRHLVLSGDGRFLFVSNNYGDTVRKIDLSGEEQPVVRGVPSRPRTMVLSDDGSVLYVVSYDDDVMSVLATEDLALLDTVATGSRPIGVTFDARNRSVWVANYSGSLMRFTPTAR